MGFVVLAVKYHVQVKQHSAAVELVSLRLFIRVQQFIAIRERRLCKVLRRCRIWIFKEWWISGNEEKGKNGGVLPVNDA